MGETGRDYSEKRDADVSLIHEGDEVPANERRRPHGRLLRFTGRD
ncbi:hypothetical protein ABH909_004496 [Pseudomonas sp. BS3782 TE3695]|jgi:hypothetical protein